jgi:peroxiredoxin
VTARFHKPPLCDTLGRMGLSGSFSVGPFTVPIRFLAMAASLAVAILAARIPLRGHRRLRAVVTERLVNVVVIFVAAWKLTPGLLHPLQLVRDPLAVLMGAPGLAGLVIGIAAAAVYAALALVRPLRLRKASRLPLVLFAAVVLTAAGVGLVGVYSAPPGPPAPALLLPALDGGSVSLESLRGRVVVVNFWATWCPPCRAELPALADFARAQGAAGAAGAVLLPVNLTWSETSEENVRAFARAHGLEGQVLLDRTGSVTKAWDVRAYPSTFVIDAQGRVSAERTGAVDSAWLRSRVAAASRR